MGESGWSIKRKCLRYRGLGKGKHEIKKGMTFQSSRKQKRRSKHIKIGTLLPLVWVCNTLFFINFAFMIVELVRVNEFNEETQTLVRWKSFDRVCIAGENPSCGEAEHGRSSKTLEPRILKYLRRWRKIEISSINIQLAALSFCFAILAIISRANIFIALIICLGRRSKKINENGSECSTFKQLQKSFRWTKSWSW